MVNVWLKRVCSMERCMVSPTIHDPMSPKYPVLHRFMTRSPHEPRYLLFGSRVGERESLLLLVSALWWHW